MVFDNGEGMTYEGLKAFATYFLSQADRGLEREEVDLTPGYLDGAISKFGVGATQAVSCHCQLSVKILKGLFSKGTVVLHNYNWYNHCCCRWLRKVCVFVFQGFYLGDRIKVITKKDECPFVTEITISKVINRNNIYNLSCSQIV